MRPQVVSTTGVATSAWIPVDRVQKPINISLHAVVAGGNTCTIEYTADDILDPNTGTPTAFPVTGMTSITANTAGNIAFPVVAVRINNTIGAGEVSLNINQSNGA